MPENFKEGDEVEVSIQNLDSKKLRFSTFNLGVKDEYLNREKIEKTEDELLSELNNESLIESAELYAEVYEADEELQQLNVNPSFHEEKKGQHRN